MAKKTMTLTRWFEACESGDLVAIQAGIDEGLWLASFKSGSNGLMTAARSGSADAVELLLRAGADPDSPDPVWGGSALAAAFSCDVRSAEPRRCMRLLLDATDPMAESEPFLAALEVCALRIACGFEPLDAELYDELSLRTPWLGERSGWGTVLLHASNARDFEHLDSWIKRGVDVDCRAHGSTALHWAVKKGQGDVAEWLLAHGSNPNSKDKKGLTPAMLCVIGLRPAPAFAGIAPSFVDPDGKLDLLKLLISRGADPDVRGPRGATALIIASSMGHPQCVQTLLEAQANHKLRVSISPSSRSIHKLLSGKALPPSMNAVSAADSHKEEGIARHLRGFAKSVEERAELGKASSKTKAQSKLTRPAPRL